MSLARAKCPHCGLVVVAASVKAKIALCRAHDAEVHGLSSDLSAALHPGLGMCVGHERCTSPLVSYDL